MRESDVILISHNCWCLSQYGNLNKLLHYLYFDIFINSQDFTTINNFYNFLQIYRIEKIHKSLAKIINFDEINSDTNGLIFFY